MSDNQPLQQAVIDALNRGELAELVERGKDDLLSLDNEALATLLAERLIRTISLHNMMKESVERAMQNYNKGTK